MNNQIKRMYLKINSYVATYPGGSYVVGMIIALSIIIMLTFISAPKYSYIIYQGDSAFRAESYIKTKDGLIFKYDRLERILVGQYVIKEL